MWKKEKEKSKLGLLKNGDEILIAISMARTF
jgi:hypothetical protein